MALVVLNGPTVMAGESLSDALDCSAGKIIRLTMPTAWSGTTISFLASTDGVGFNDLMKPDGHEVTATVVAGTAIIGLALDTGFIKIRSGTRDVPVVQTAQHTFAVTIDTGAAAAPAGNELRVRLLGALQP